MSYFNHAFQKVFIGTGADLASTDKGFLTTAGIPSVALGSPGTTQYSVHYGPGYFGLFDPKTYKSVTTASIAGSCCPLVLASASLMSKDKIGPMAGGYQESNKSKIINPKFVHKFYRVDPCTPQQAVVSVGNTPWTHGGITALVIGAAGTTYTNGTYTDVPLAGLSSGVGATANVTVAGGLVTAATIVLPGYGYTPTDHIIIDESVIGAGDGAAYLTATMVAASGNCCFEFLCGETYYLRIDVKGSPALRFLNHNAYHTLDAYTGCCAGPDPTVVDSTTVMITWAKQIIDTLYLSPFVMPVVFDEAGVPWYAPGTTAAADGTAVISSQWWDAYPETAHVDGACAGLRLYGAYVGTTFNDCTFQTSDFFEKEPVKILASMVDYTGDPCTFEGICVVDECLGLQGMGFGEQVLRDLIMSESYLQNYVNSGNGSDDLRIREITLGTDIISAVTRSTLYTRYYILHSVPRYNNPTGTFDTDQYMLEIISNGTMTVFESTVQSWLDDCSDCNTMETETCVPCVLTPDIPEVIG